MWRDGIELCKLVRGECDTRRSMVFLQIDPGESELTRRDARRACNFGERRDECRFLPKLEPRAEPPPVIGCQILQRLDLAGEEASPEWECATQPMPSSLMGWPQGNAPL
jgi:hypothetical protein